MRKIIFVALLGLLALPACGQDYHNKKFVELVIAGKCEEARQYAVKHFDTDSRKFAAMGFVRENCKPEVGK